MNNTKYTIKFASIWNTSSTRDEAHEKIVTRLDENMAYKTMMNKVKYMRMRGVEMQDLHRDSVDWEAVRLEVNASTTAETT